MEFTLFTLVLLKLLGCCHLHHMALLTTLAHSLSEQSSAYSPAPVPVCEESSRTQHSTPLSAISSVSNSDSNYPSSGLITLSASVCSSGGSSLSSISTVSPIVSPLDSVVYHVPLPCSTISESWLNSTSSC